MCYPSPCTDCNGIPNSSLERFLSKLLSNSKFRNSFLTLISFHLIRFCFYSKKKKINLYLCMSISHSIHQCFIGTMKSVHLRYDFSKVQNYHGDPTLIVRNYVRNKYSQFQNKINDKTAKYYIFSASSVRSDKETVSSNVKHLNLYISNYIKIFKNH